MFLYNGTIHVSTPSSVVLFNSECFPKTNFQRNLLKRQKQHPPSATEMQLLQSTGNGTNKNFSIAFSEPYLIFNAISLDR